MKQDRRQFIHHSLAGLAALSIYPAAIGGRRSVDRTDFESKPWLEISEAAYLHNATQVSKMAGGKPVLAVLKNNAYGIGDIEVAKILDQSTSISGIAVVKDERALAMREAGVSKPILLMGDFDLELSDALVEHGISLSIYAKSSLEKIERMAASAAKPVKVAFYLDTGLGRMGIPHREAVELAVKTAALENVTITQTFSTLTTPRDFAQEQIRRFEEITRELERRNIPVGIKHLAPSYSFLDLPASRQDAVRPGILLHGSFPLAKMPVAAEYPLQIPFKLKAPVIRLEKLPAGSTIGFSRFYKVEEDEWIATLPIGWADGYDSGAERGAKVLIGDRLYTVVNVNASHANISLGKSTGVKVRDVATLIGPDRPEITPEGFGQLVDGHNYLQINYKESISKRVYESF